MADTKIINATTALTSATAQTTDKLAVGRTGSTDSLNISLAELKSWLGVTLDKIEEGNSRVEVVDTGTGYVTLVLDNVEILRFESGALKPRATGVVDLGSATNVWKDIHMSGGIELGSDATGDIYYRDASGDLERLPAGTAGDVLVMGASVPSWGTSSIDFVPNYFVTNWTELVAAIADINSGSTGGNVFMAGNFIMTANVSWDLTNVRFYGNNAYWRVYDADFDLGTNYKVTITAGSPTFDNIQFLGSLTGAIAQTFSTYDTREVIELTGNNGQDLVFNNCTFGDIIGGTSSGNAVITVTGIPANTASVLSFRNCVMSSHNNSINFSYDGFTIDIGGTYSGYCYGKIHNQLFSERALDSANTSTTYTPIATVGGAAELQFEVDETAQINDSNVTGTISIDTPVTRVEALSTIADDDRMLIGDNSDNDIIKSVRVDVLKTLFGGISTSDTSFNAAAVATLGTPSTLIAAPGANQVIQLLSIFYILDYDVSGITLATETLNIYYSGHVSSPIIPIPNADVVAAADKNIQYLPVAPVDWYSNTAVVVGTSGGTNPSLSDNTSIRLILTYNVIDIS